MVCKDIPHQVQKLEKIAKTSFYFEKSKNLKKVQNNQQIKANYYLWDNVPNPTCVPNISFEFKSPVFAGVSGLSQITVLNFIPLYLQEKMEDLSLPILRCVQLNIVTVLNPGHLGELSAFESGL